MNWSTTRRDVACNVSTKLRKKVVRAIADFDLLTANDRVMVGISGGVDSIALLLLLEDVRKKSPVAFSLHPVMLDQKHPGFDPTPLQSWMTENGFQLTIIEEDTFSIVTQKTKPGKSICRICSRLRRGVLYNYAAEHHYSKIALGHHRDDLNETLLMNMLYSGELSGMPPKLRSDDGRNTVIRPMCYLSKPDIEALQRQVKFPILPDGLCGYQDNSSRDTIRHLLDQLEADNPKIKGNLLAAQKNIRVSQLLDQNLWSFKDPEPE